jgi:hypothetical protein
MIAARNDREPPAMTTGQRIALGALAAVLSVLVFHQGMILLLRETGLFGFPRGATVWSLAPNPRAFGLPTLVNQCFWGGLYGAAFGLLAGRVRLSNLTLALLTGAATTLVGFFIIAAIRGTPIAGGWQLMAWLRGLSIGLSFGLGLYLFHTLLTTRIFPPPLPRR